MFLGFAADMQGIILSAWGIKCPELCVVDDISWEFNTNFKKDTVRRSTTKKAYTSSDKSKIHRI